MTDIIYGVYESGGSYDDYFHNIVKCWSTREDADAHVAKLEKERDIKLAAVRVRDTFRNEWHQNNRYTVQAPSKKKLKSWNGLRKGQITDEMRAEKAVADAEYSEACRVFQEGNNAYYLKGQEALKAHLLEKGIPEELVEELQNCYIHNTDVSYDIEEVELD